jgi:arabinosaccharide transport system substrate-binding protein
LGRSHIEPFEPFAADNEMKVTSTHRRKLRIRGQILSPGAWIILIIAIVSGAFVLSRKNVNQDHDLEFWVFADTHYEMYTDLLEKEWNPQHQPVPGDPKSGLRVKAIHLTNTAEQQKMLSGFYSETPIADLLEIERGKVGAAFAMPLDQIGFYDLTERLKAKGPDGLSLLDKINEPSFSPWTTQGHIFGLPHDIHPVMLCYHADTVEAAGIDVSKIETWDDFVRLLGPLMKEKDKDGSPKHSLLNLYTEGVNQIEMLMLQNDGRYFDENGAPDINTPQNAQTIAQIVLWCTGDTVADGGTRIAMKAPEFNNGADNNRATGKVIASMVPDWLAGFYQRNIPQMGGKVKLMPMPAWKKGGRRTSIWGGTMLGISKRTPDFEKAWKFALELYTSPKIAEKLYRDAGIVSPVKAMWTSPIYDEPVPYYSGQPRGRLFLNLASEVPRRTSSPFHEQAVSMFANVVLRVEREAKEKKITTLEPLQALAKQELDKVNQQLQKMIDNDLFHKAK